MTDRRIAVLIYPGFQTLDAIGPVDVFAGLNQYLDSSDRSGSRYVIETVGIDAGPTRSESGVQVVADRSLDDRGDGPIDTLVVAGGAGVTEAAENAQVTDWVTNEARTARRVCSVCSGTFILASAGLLDGHTVTTHWARGEQLAAAFPSVDVDVEPIHRRSGNIWTSAGVTAGIDLALALVEDDHGADAAQTIARWLVMFLRRPGGQSQFATPVWTEAAEYEPIRRAQDAINAAPEADHSIEATAARVGMSPRHFTRMFRTEVGVTPARYVEQVRVDGARRRLESTSAGLEAVAAASGFGTTETMRRAFLRQIGVSPSDYRSRFRTDSPTP